MTTDTHIEHSIREQAAHDGQFAIAYGLLKCALWLKYLGGGDNADTRGAVEYLGMQVEKIADAIREAAP